MSDAGPVIGRSGIHIEPDVEYIDSYRKAGEIANRAGDGKCGHTTRPELPQAVRIGHGTTVSLRFLRPEGDGNAAPQR